MKQRALIAGTGMTCFGKHLDRTLTSLAHEAIQLALNDAGISVKDVQAAWSGTVAAPIITGQTCIAGQAILRGLGLGRIPVVNVENACATASTAFHQACTMVSLGAYDVVLAFGVEKLYHADKSRTLAIFEGAVDVDRPDAITKFLKAETTGADRKGDDGRHSLFMDIYARWTKDYMDKTGVTVEEFAEVSAKNSLHGSLNPLAQFRNVVTPSDVLAAPMISPPLTLLMCSPIGDGAAAAIIMSERAAARHGIRKPIRVLSTKLASGSDPDDTGLNMTQVVSRAAYEESGVGPADIDCIELHDATSPAEAMLYEYLGLCAGADIPKFIREGGPKLGGRRPINTSGGLVRKGHPIGATGIAQLHELALQLRGEAGQRQVPNAKIGLAENGGGFLNGDMAALTITILGG